MTAVYRELGGLHTNTVKGTYYEDSCQLSALDLNQSRAEVAARDLLLGQAAGQGIARGLEVRRPADGDLKSLLVKAGLGIAPSGRIVWLAKDTLLRLANFEESPQSGGMIAETDEGEGQPEAEFVPCNAVRSRFRPMFPGLRGESTFKVRLEDGPYLLTACGDSCLSMPKSGSAGPCGNGRIIDGVRFRLIALPEDTAPRAEEAKEGAAGQWSRYRNRLAYWHFGAGDLRTGLTDPFTLASFTPYSGLLQAIQARALALEADDLPLAVVLIQNQAVTFIEMWPARRRLTQDGPATFWEPISGDRRAAEGQARFYQFQEQLANLGSLDKPLETYFRWLPPVGYLPLLFRDSAFTMLYTLVAPAYLEQTLRNARGQVWAAQADIATSANRRALLRAVVGLLRERLKVAPASGIDVSNVLENFQITLKIGDVETGHHLLNRSWYDPPIDLNVDRGLDLYLILGGWQRIVQSVFVAVLTGTDPQDPKALSKSDREILARIRAADATKAYLEWLRKTSGLPAALPDSIEIPAPFAVFTRASAEIENPLALISTMTVDPVRDTMRDAVHRIIR